MNLTVDLVAFFLIFGCTNCQSGELFTDTQGSCNTIIDSIKQTIKDRDDITQINEPGIYRPERQKYFIIGLGPAYSYNIETDLLSYDFFGGHFWQINDILSLGLSGGLLTEFQNSILIDAAFTALYYPFVTKIIPFGGASLGPAFLKTENERGAGLSSALELGAIISESLPFVLVISARLNIFIKGSTPVPLFYAFRAGVAF